MLLVTRGSPFAANDCRNDLLQMVNIFRTFGWCHPIPELFNSMHQFFFVCRLHDAAFPLHRVDFGHVLGNDIQDRLSFILIRSKHVFKKTTFASEYAILLTNLQRLFNLKKDILCLKLTENLERDNVFCCYFVCIKPQFVSRWRPCGSSRKEKTRREKLLNTGKLVTLWSTKYL